MPQHFMLMKIPLSHYVDVVATDKDGDTITFSIESDTPEFQINPVTGAMSIDKNLSTSNGKGMTLRYRLNGRG